MINFDALPTSKPAGGGALLEKGRYAAVVKDAKMKTSSKGTKYLTVMFQTKTNPAVNVFDNFFDSDKPLVMFKLGQFLRALPNTISGQLTLEDIAKICMNKEMVVAIKQETNEGYAPRNVVDAYDDVIYARIDAVDENVNTDGYPLDDSDTPFGEDNY